MPCQSGDWCEALALRDVESALAFPWVLIDLLDPVGHRFAIIGKALGGCFPGFLLGDFRHERRQIPIFVSIDGEGYGNGL